MIHGVGVDVGCYGSGSCRTLYNATAAVMLASGIVAASAKDTVSGMWNVESASVIAY